MGVIVLAARRLARVRQREPTCPTQACLAATLSQLWEARRGYSRRYQLPRPVLRNKSARGAGRQSRGTFGSIWHDAAMLRVAESLIRLVSEALRRLWLSVRSTKSIKAENLFLRRQLALYIERGVKPRRVDWVTRIGLTLLSRFFDWRDALVVVRHPTLIGWHRAG
jgi:hypothetical protein